MKLLDHDCVVFSLIMAAWAFCPVAAEGNAAPEKIKAGEMKVFNVDSLASGYSLEAKTAIAGNRDANGLGKAMWSLEWIGTDGKPLRTLEIKWGNERLGDPLDRRYMQVSVDSISPSGNRLNLVEKKLYEGADMYGGWNTLSVEDDGKSMNVWIGNDLEYYIGTATGVKGMSNITMSGTRDLKVEYVVCLPHENRSRALTTKWTYDSLLSHLNNGSAKEPEGIWRFLDRDTNAKWAEPGGKYTLAVVRSDSDLTLPGDQAFKSSRAVYDIIYIDGARVNGSSWKTGMIKGRMFATVFENHYELLWYDADMEPMVEELSADVADNVILSLNFPLLHSIIRFSREK